MTFLADLAVRTIKGLQDCKHATMQIKEKRKTMKRKAKDAFSVVENQSAD